MYEKRRFFAIYLEMEMLRKIITATIKVYHKKTIAPHEATSS